MRVGRCLALNVKRRYLLPVPSERVDHEEKLLWTLQIF